VKTATLARAVVSGKCGLKTVRRLG